MRRETKRTAMWSFTGPKLKGSDQEETYQEMTLSRLQKKNKTFISLLHLVEIKAVGVAEVER